jgi:hypothetical protein
LMSLPFKAVGYWIFSGKIFKNGIKNIILTFFQMSYYFRTSKR